MKTIGAALAVLVLTAACSGDDDAATGVEAEGTADDAGTYWVNYQVSLPGRGPAR